MSIARNTFYNLVGTLTPMALAIVTVPAYLALIGPARYGIVSIGWLILGYFGLFDLGLGRATAHRIAELRDASPEERATTFGTALASNLAVGLVGALVTGAIAWYMFAHGLSLTPDLRREAVAAAPLLALALPVATVMGVLSGAMMGRERFLDVNRLNLTSTVLFQLFPLAVAYLFGPNVAGVLAASLAARLVGVVLLFRACRGEFGAGAARRFDRAQLRGLLAYGGWVTLTSMLGPLLVIADRFAIGVFLNAVAVTVYTIPMQLTSRLGGIATSLGNALFPRLAVAQGEDAARLSRDGVAALMCCLTPPALAAFFAMEPGLVLWVGSDIGHQAAPIGRILLVAAWLNTFAQVPYVRLQAQGRPDVVSKVLVAELPFYLPALAAGLYWYGLMGAAIVYLVRVVGDLVALMLFAGRRVEHARAITAFAAIFAAAELLIRGTAPGQWAALLLAMAAGAGAAGPCWLLLPEDGRRLVLRMARGAQARLAGGR